MITVFKLTDRIPVKISRVTFWLSPLSYGQKNELLAEFRSTKAGEETFNRQAYGLKAVSASLKKVEGVKLANGADFELEFDQNGLVSEESIECVMSLTNSALLIAACDRLLFKGEDFLTLDGVDVDLSKVESVKKK